MDLQKNDRLHKEEGIELDFFKGRLVPEELLADLGIQMAHRDGDWIMCHCPDFGGNHKNGDSNPSFGFDTERLVYNCFVCGGGTLFRLVEEMEDIDREAAEKWLLAHSDLEPAETNKFQEQIEAILTQRDEAVVDPEYPNNALFPFNKTHPYLIERGLTKEVISNYQIGFDEQHLGITIPHFFQGKLKGWQTRHLVEAEGKYWCPECELNPKYAKKIPKYKNTPNFPKQNTLYGYDQAMAYCKLTQTTWMLVVESPFTALYLASKGFHNVMATFGSFNQEQSSLLWPFKEVYFWPDNDGAGRENAGKAIKYLWTYVELYLVDPVPGEKSDAANLASLDTIREYILKAVPAALYKPKTNL